MQKSVDNRRTMDSGMLLSTSHSADSQTHVTVPLMCLSVYGAAAAATTDVYLPNSHDTDANLYTGSSVESFVHFI